MQPKHHLLLSLGVAGILSLTPEKLRAHADLDDQIVSLTKQIQQEPNKAALYLRRADLYRIHQEWGRAAADFARVESLDPGLPGVDMLRGQMLLEAGQPKDALVSLNRFLQREPHNPDGHALRARTYVALHRNDAALADYNAAVTNATLNAMNYYSDRAQLLATMGEARLDEAVRGLDEGMARIGRAGTLEQQAISIRMTQGKFDDALARLDAMLARATRKETLLLQRGQIFEKAGRLAEAAQSCRQALAELDKLPPYRRRVKATLNLEATIKTEMQRFEQLAKNKRT